MSSAEGRPCDRIRADAEHAIELSAATPVAPELWAQTLSAAPVLERVIAGAVPATVRRWQGIAPDIDQFALDRHFISFHLGGAKRLLRRGEGTTAVRDVSSGAYSVVPAGAAFRWETTGPIDFMHVYFDPRTVAGMIERDLDRDPARIELHESLGGDDPLICALAAGLIDELDQTEPQQVYLDDLLRLLLGRILRLHSNVCDSAMQARMALAPYRLRRALDFIETNLAEPVGVADIAGASGISRFHFSRAFQRATGMAPYAYLMERRIAAAKSLLIHTDLSLAQVGAQSGFSSPSQFSRTFRNATGKSPSAFRDCR